MIAPGLAEPRHDAHRNLGDILDEDRQPARRRQHDVLDVADLVALGQIRLAAGIHQADAAHVHGLLADVDGAAADIDVGVAERGDHLLQRHAIGLKLPRIDLDVVFLGGAAPGVDLHDAGHGKQAPLQYPVLDRAQVAQAEMRRTHQLVAVDFADEARSLNLRRDSAGKADVLLQIDRDLRQREIVIDVVLEYDADERQPEERGRANDVDAGRRREPHLDRDRVIALHLLGGEAAGLRGDLQHDRRRIGIGLDVEPGKRKNAGRHKAHQAQQDQRTPRQAESEKSFKQRVPPNPKDCAAANERKLGESPTLLKPR